MSHGMRYANQVGIIFPELESFFVAVFHRLDFECSFFWQALLSGCSAGGVASILHCDEFRSLFPSSMRVKCLSDAGLFLDS